MSAFEGAGTAASQHNGRVLPDACPVPVAETRPPGSGPVKKINLALQGGGAHGAYTWGVLDCLLDDPRIEIEGISGTSAGAMNAAVLAEGITEGGRAYAREELRRFWKAISDSSWYSPLKTTWWDRLQGRWSLDHLPAYHWSDYISRMFSPYDLNPMGWNPLRDLVEKTIRFQYIQHCTRLKLFITATNVRTGHVRVFHNHEITPDVLMAAACLPYLFKAPYIDGDYYWDGGYMGNPSLYPLFKCDSNDVVIVQINPIARPGLPRTAREIINRIDEISFNASLIQELRAIEFVTRLLEEERIPTTRYKRMLIHRIESCEDITPLGASSKFNTDWQFFEFLHDLGYQAAQQWLAQHFDALGQRSTLDVKEAILASPEDNGQRAVQPQQLVAEGAAPPTAR
jgi:NTE family protein